MAEDRKQSAEAAAAPYTREPATAENAIAAEPAIVSETVEAVDASEKLSQLFDHLKIAKIVFIDDKAELQTDAGAVIKTLAAKPEASEALATFFKGVALDLSNEALQEQLTARLAELNGDRLAELRAVLSAQSEDAAEREALGRLQDLLPEGATTRLLTPQGWKEHRADLIAECTEGHRTLFLIDQELDVDDADLGFKKGSDIIRDLANSEEAGFGTRWFCGMLTHTVEKGEEVSSWRALEKSENLDLRFFMPIAKTTLDDSLAFYAAVYRTLINTYCQTMKSLAADAFEKALKDALEQFSDLDPIDFEHVIVKSSETEGVSELETLIRVYGIIHKDKIKTQILQQATVKEFSAAARRVLDIADIAREISATSQERLHKLRLEELYEGDDLINGFNDPLRNGDVFEIGEGNDVKLWVLIAQPCDLMVRSKGTRARENNFKVTVLAPLRMEALGEKVEMKEGLSFSLEHFDHHGAQSALVQFADATPANLHVLDLAVLNSDGQCHLSAAADPELSLHSKAWENRDKKLRKYFKKVTDKIEKARKQHDDEVASLIAAEVIPRASPKKSFANFGTYNNGEYSYPIRRCRRVRDPLAISLLSAFGRFLARDAYEHDFSRLG